VDLRPAHARHAPVREANGASGNQPEPVDTAVLVAAVERELQPEADPEHEAAGLDALAKRDVVAALAETVHRGARGADAREHRQVGTQDVVDPLAAEPLEGQLDRAHIPGAVLADREPHNVPLVDGRPDPSMRTAPRSARPTALNA